MKSSVIESMCLMCRAWGNKDGEKQLQYAVGVYLAFCVEKSPEEWAKFSEKIIGPLKDLARSDSRMVKKYYAGHMLMLSEMRTETYSDILEEISIDILFDDLHDRDWKRYGMAMAPLMTWFDDEFKKGEKHE